MCPPPQPPPSPSSQARSEHPVQVAVALLPQDDRFLLQLRDNVPGIPYPGQWGFFGGHLEAGEDPITGLLRELEEEIGYKPRAAVQLFGEYPDDRINRYIFHTPLTVPIDQLVLGEGWDFKLVTVAEIRAGEVWSEVAQETRPIGVLHRQILLDFIATRPA
ncbi:MAG: NUDIX hydrolase [Prochlorothrix sp.]|nr:NUDIX hydrolase [Prochlorothrix sp.]